MGEKYDDVDFQPGRQQPGRTQQRSIGYHQAGDRGGSLLSSIERYELGRRTAAVGRLVLRGVGFRHHGLLREFGVIEMESEWTARVRETQIWAGPERLFLNPG